MNLKAADRRTAVKIEKRTYRKVRRIAETNRMRITDVIDIAVSAFDQLPESDQVRLIRTDAPAAVS